MLGVRGERQQHLILSQVGIQSEAAHLIANVNRGGVIFGRAGDVGFRSQTAQFFARIRRRRHGAKLFFEFALVI